jgi:uncharacterized membrane protein YoaK (UPF0700 family)
LDRRAASSRERRVLVGAIWTGAFVGVVIGAAASVTFRQALSIELLWICAVFIAFVAYGAFRWERKIVGYLAICAVAAGLAATLVLIV